MTGIQTRRQQLSKKQTSNQNVMDVKSPLARATVVKTAFVPRFTYLDSISATMLSGVKCADWMGSYGCIH